jgi:hypothetical protein
MTRHRRLWFFLILFGAPAGIAAGSGGEHEDRHQHARTPGMERGHGSHAMRTQGPPPLYEGWDGQRRRITTRSRAAQRYFDQGLNLVYARF